MHRCRSAVHCSTGTSAAVPAAAAVGTPWHSQQQRRRCTAACSLAPLKNTSLQQDQVLLTSLVPCGMHQAQQHAALPPQQRGQLIQRRAGPIDAAPAWTLDQIAGLVFGVVMLAFYFGSQQVDVIIAKQQRKQLGLCERCGGLNEPATCSQEGCPMKGKAV